VLGHRGLIEAEGGHDIPDRALLESEKIEDGAAAWLSDGVEGVGSGGSAGHRETIHTYMGICQEYFDPLAKPALLILGGGVGLLQVKASNLQECLCVLPRKGSGPAELRLKKPAFPSGAAAARWSI
jgi:hypothetical protein